MEIRQKKLLALIECAKGKPVYAGAVAEEGEHQENDDTTEAAQTIPALKKNFRYTPICPGSDGEPKAPRSR